MSVNRRTPSGTPWEGGVGHGGVGHAGVGRRWRFYRTPDGREPVRDFLNSLEPAARRQMVAGMKRVQRDGAKAGRHLEEDRREVRVSQDGRGYRVSFSAEGTKARVLLALSGFEKKTRATPQHELRLARQRQTDWRARGREYGR